MNAYRRNGTDLRRNTSGLTVFEVIFILIVLVVIAAILFPVFARPDRGCHRSTCQSNMKECAIALQTYWNDYDGHLPSSALVGGSKKWNERDFYMFASTVGHLPPKPEERLTTWSQLLYDYMRRKDIMFCDSDPEDHDSPDAHVSYYWKAAIDKAWYGEQCVKPCRAEADFGYNADQIVLYERAGFHSGASDSLKNDVMINVAYMDTHVKSVSIVNCPRERSNPSAWGEPAYFNFDNDRPKKDGVNPPPPSEAAKHVDPSRYSDMLP